jgi:hypothetical protein
VQPKVAAASAARAIKVRRCMEISCCGNLL